MVIAGNINRAQSTIHLCGACAAIVNEQLFKAQSSASLEAFVSQLAEKIGFDLPTEEGIEAVPEGEELLCPRCGLAIAESATPQLLGCPECYTAFARQLTPLIESLHRGSVHRGKIPGAPPADAAGGDTVSRYDMLNRQLALAVDREDYEEAAGLRDEIRRLEPACPEAGTE